MEQKRELTRAELDIMKIIWAGENLFLSDIVAAIPEPRPAYTTVSTIVRVLVRKGFVAYKSYSKIHCYYPLVSKEEYMEDVMCRVSHNFFGGSVASMISFFARKEHLTKREREELIEMISSDE